MAPFARIVLLPLASACAVTLAAPAGATANFPTAIQADLSLASAPPCALCHTTGDSGGRGTVNTPFGVSVRGHGLVAFDETALKTALDAMAADHTDSDSDCVDDIDELKQGSDPNTATPAAGCDAGGGGATAAPLQPRYGCGAHVAARGAGGTLDDAMGCSAIGIVALAGLVTRRRRRR
jgi:hypothetical protein